MITIGLCLLCFALGWLVLHLAKQATSERERANYNEDAAKEIKSQADRLGTVRTDADTVSSLRRKAADKRVSETNRNK